ncbi:rab-GTPase-TBC domain-containing protein [Radiomyces spectabilis]|uniref:rab-GTPase-TBC domain-containing protein n=1 Tax=Radiomyces spectabilis TaxID=64574 RepID=UPI00221EC190|nr:rab-GTPase-TBC domain-containing protein [Radiomyces spectabilis]KAI8369574.1 rab-GTPase-TBC domain-containing protein [Radiomyces spectabilis]
MPPGTAAGTSPPSTSSYYDKLVAKFGRTSQDDHHKDRINEETEILKEESKISLDRLKENSDMDDYDWEFWSSVISDVERVKSKESGRLKENLSLGVPPSLRGMLWQIFSKSKNNSNVIETEYRELLHRTSPHEKLIRGDLARTFPSHSFYKERDGEGQEALFNVIKAYSIFDQQVGYCQGLPFVVGCLLLHMPDEAAFCVLVKMMSCYGLRGLFTRHMEKLHERLYQFNQLLLYFLPEVHRHLDAQGVVPSMYAAQWFMTLFAYRCPLELVFRVYDVVFVEGSQIVLNFALALMRRNQQTILSLEFEGLLAFFAENIYDEYKNDAYGFVKDAYSFTISSRHLAKLSKQYAAQVKREAKLHSEEDQLKRKNRELTDQKQRIEKAYAMLESEHQEVARQVIESKMNMARLDEENQQLRRSVLQLQIEIDKIRKTINVDRQAQFDELARRNSELVQQNSALEDQLVEVESQLIEFKMKYADSENQYEVMKQKLYEAQRLSSFR